jgi:hypothetical protein
VVAMEGTGAETEEAMGLTETRVVVRVPGRTENTYNYLLSSVRNLFYSCSPYLYPYRSLR